MNEPLFEPYALQQRWSLPEAIRPEQWSALFGAYLERLAQACGSSSEGPTAPGVVIGHIKLLALFPESDFLRVSTVRAGDPPTVTGRVPPGLARIDTTLNLLVYGLDHELLAACAARDAATVAAQWSGTVVELPISGSRQHAH